MTRSRVVLRFARRFAPQHAVKAALALAVVLGAATVSVAITRADPATADPTSCPRHFLSLAWKELQNCAAAYSARGLSIHAFARNGDAYGGSNGRLSANDAFAGSFEPGPPRTLDLSNLPWNACSPMVAILDGEPDNVPTVCGDKKRDPATRVVMLEVNYRNGRAADIDVDPSDPKIRKRYVATISSLAGRGFVPYRVVVHQQIGAGVSPEAGIIVQHLAPGDTASVYLPDSATLAAFERRAAAKGFQPFHYDGTAVIWRRHVGKTVVMRKQLSDAAFATVDGEQTTAGLALIDIFRDKDGWRAVWAL
jgi:hypothetical protein